METVWILCGLCPIRRSHEGRFCTEREAEIDRKFTAIRANDAKIARLERQVEYWRRQAEALGRLFVENTDGIFKLR